jgi:hypothetical protein
MRTNGLAVLDHELYWGGLGALPDWIYGPVLRPIQAQWWAGHAIARRQRVVIGAPRRAGG